MSDRREPRTLVLDTSVAIKWYLTEELTDEAVRLLDSARDSASELLAPGTLQPEFFRAPRGSATTAASWSARRCAGSGASSSKTRPPFMLRRT